MSSQSYKEFRALLKRRAYGEAAYFAENQSLLYGDENEFWLTQQAIALTRAGKFEQAVTIAEQALSLAPNGGYALLAKADATLGAGCVEEALACYQELITSQDNKITARARTGFLRCLVRLKVWTRILSLLAQWNLPPSEAVSWRVEALTGLKRNDEAIGACREWLRINQDNPQALWKLTGLEVAGEGLEAVRTRFSRLAKIPSRPPVYREIYASLCRRAGKMDEAVEQYTKLSVSSSSFRIQRKRAFALAKAGREEAAIPIMEELLRSAPKDIYLNSAFTAACRRAGELERAWKFYQELISLHPDIKTIYGHIRRIEKEL